MLEAIKLNLENRTLTKKFLAGRVTDDELLDIALKIRAKSPTPSPKAGRRSSTLPRATIPTFVFHAIATGLHPRPSMRILSFLADSGQLRLPPATSPVSQFLRKFR
jgi:hypothetical protein